MKPFIPVLMTASERAALLTEFAGTSLSSGSLPPPVAAKVSVPGASEPAGVVSHLKAALSAAGKRLAEAGAAR